METTSVPPNRQWVYIAVVDNGIGIDSMDIMGLFEPYEQSGGSKRYRAEGTGWAWQFLNAYVNCMEAASASKAS